MSKFMVGDKVRSNENYAGLDDKDCAHTGVVTDVFYDDPHGIHRNYPVRVYLDNSDVLGLFADDELDLIKDV